MNQVCEPAVMREVGEYCPQKSMVRIAWLESMRPIAIQECDDPGFRPAPYDTINWTPLKDFQRYVLRLVCEVCGVSQQNLTESPAFQDVNHRLKKPCVAIMTTADFLIPNEMQGELDAALTHFCRLVLEGQEIEGQEQFFPVEPSERTIEIVTSLAEEFLATVSGKKVGEPRLLKTRDCEIFVSGTYRQKKDKPLPEPERWTVIGEIDGLRGAIRSVFVVTEERKTLPIVFDEAKFKNPLRDRVLDGEKYQFVIETEWIAHDRKVDTLMSFDFCSGGDPILI